MTGVVLLAAMSLAEIASLLRDQKPAPPAFRLGTIPDDYTGGRPRILFDGETAPTTRAYPMNADLTLAPGDRVLVAMVGHGGVVLCKIK
ncbi:MAG: hypothetical protein CWE10_04165 [Symbiobacterium thermophilum]|uniref:Uncharacterized protein n=2 Tax=Symbiobacterium thermophilum TaxID=2734 RepID=A0A953LHX3_SYMTR|nr:hypothetical protein [Symbiobacterium thermophilum]